MYFMWSDDDNNLRTNVYMILQAINMFVDKATISRVGVLI